MTDLHFEQDGGYFFVRLRPFYNLDFDHEHIGFREECRTNVAPSDHIVAPFPVYMHGDSAERAVAWFEAECAKHGYRPIRDDYAARPEYADHPECEHAAIRAEFELRQMGVYS